jgi:hypothetical protein
MTHTFDLKQSELVVEGYTLILRGPKGHQHEAVLDAFKQLDLAPLWSAIKPIADAASGPQGTIVAKIAEVLPGALAAVKDQILVNGVRACLDAAAICLDNRTNFNRLSKPCPDADYDSAMVGDVADDFERGADGSSYLRSGQVRDFVRGNITTDGAFWVLFETIRLGGFADVGKALAANLLGSLGALAGAAKPATTEPVTA